jgi:hypothetical protein
MTAEKDLKLRGVVTICVTVIDNSGKKVEREETLICTGNLLPEVGTVLQREVYELLVQAARAVETPGKG